MLLPLDAVIYVQGMAFPYSGLGDRLYCIKNLHCAIKYCIEIYPNIAANLYTQGFHILLYITAETPGQNAV